MWHQQRYLYTASSPGQIEAAASARGGGATPTAPPPALPAIDLGGGLGLRGWSWGPQGAGPSAAWHAHRDADL